MPPPTRLRIAKPRPAGRCPAAVAQTGRRPVARRLAPVRPGAIMIITLLALILLVALVLYVLNLGKQVNGRVVTQHSADSSAAAGAGWVARSFNNVAMNNVAMARMVALVPVLDAVPLTASNTLKDQTMLRDALEAQLHPTSPRTLVSDSFVTTKLNEGLTGVIREIDMLTPVDALFNLSGYDVREMTWYDGPGGRGKIWQALEGLDDLNQLTMENLGVLAQLNAVRGGEANLGGHDVNAALMLPLLPQVPWRRGRFDDFERPVRNGLLPIGTDHPQENRGPYDAVFGWRYPIAGRSTGYYVGPEQVASGGTPNVPLGGGVGHDGHWVTTSRDPDAYGVYGPYQHMLNSFGGLGHGSMPFSRIGQWARRISAIKLNYLWPDPQNPGTTVNVPEWITSFPAAVSRAESNAASIVETCFLVVQIRSRYTYGHALFLSPGSWTYVINGSTPQPLVRYAGGWMDPREWHVPQTANDVWRDEWTYQVFYDGTIGIFPVDDPDTHAPIPQTVYRIDHYMFAGINIGTSVDVANPFNVADHNTLPAPTDLDHALVTPSPAARRQHLTYLAVARRGDNQLLWPHRFQGGKPGNYMMALAQAQVFNNHSWDLWTQMWHSQLQPIDAYDQWLTTASVSGGDLSAVPFVSPEDYSAIQVYLENVQPLTELMVSH